MSVPFRLSLAANTAGVFNNFVKCSSMSAGVGRDMSRNIIFSTTLRPTHGNYSRKFALISLQNHIPKKQAEQPNRIKSTFPQASAILDLPIGASRTETTHSKIGNPLHISNDSNEESSETNKKKSKPKKLNKKKKGGRKVVLQRLTKVLADRGLGTRSEVFELAKAKRICIADSPDAPNEERRRLKGPSERVPSTANLFLDGKLIPGPAPLLLVYHKPKYVLSVMEDDKKYIDQQRRHLGQVLEPRYVRSGMHPVGRLDYDTTGLILFSSEGKLTQTLLHPKRGIEKEYVATVQGKVNEGELSEVLSKGVETTEGIHTAKLIEVTPSDGPVNDDDGENAMDAELGEDERNHTGEDYSGPYSDVRLVVKEGKYRMVRRMLANCGHPVVELRRERHGNILLKDLPVGKFRNPTQEELDWAESFL